jgi:uncharacterized membrane protein HdeD (DUF308 family)
MSLPLPAPPASLQVDELATRRRLWWQILILGLVSIVIGILAISSTFVATMASVVVFGVLLMIAGFSEVIHALMVRSGKGFALHLLAAALYLIVGLVMLEDPVRAATVLTLLIAASFFVGGLLRILFSVVLRFPAWPWVLLHGVIDMFLGVVILSGWPESSLWVIGLFVGIDLLFHGLSWVTLGLALRNPSAAPSI